MNKIINILYSFNYFCFIIFIKIFYNLFKTKVK